MREDKECPFSGVTKSGRVWRKVPESDARSVGLQHHVFGNRVFGVGVYGVGVYGVRVYIVEVYGVVVYSVEIYSVRVYGVGVYTASGSTVSGSTASGSTAYSVRVYGIMVFCARVYGGLCMVYITRVRDICVQIIKVRTSGLHCLPGVRVDRKSTWRIAQ